MSGNLNLQKYKSYTKILQPLHHRITILYQIYPNHICNNLIRQMNSLQKIIYYKRNAILCRGTNLPHALSFTRSPKICMFRDKGFAHRTCTKTSQNSPHDDGARGNRILFDENSSLFAMCSINILFQYKTLYFNAAIQCYVVLLRQCYTSQDAHQFRPPQKSLSFIFFHVHVPSCHDVNMLT